MKLALLGLGKMGWNLMLNLLDHGHEVVAYDIHAETVRQAAEKGAEPAGSAEEAMQLLGEQKIVWMMVPAGEITENLINELKPLLSERDVLIDGGNSNYKDTVRRYEALKNQGVSYVDVGTSGGMEGARGGACTMIGGDQKVFEQIEPIFKDISVENGYLYTGKSGSGHKY